MPDTIEDEKHYGMHRHFTDAGCVLMFGGGMKRGHLHGVTADERPCNTLKDRGHHRGPPRHDLTRRWASRRSSPTKSRQRPFYVTRDGLGKAIQSLFV